MRRTLALALALLLVPSPAWAADQAETHLAQARLFVKKHWYADAMAELEAAIANPGSADLFELHWLACQVAWELLDVDAALSHAREAARLAPDPDRKTTAADLVASYEEGFGFLTVRGPYQGLTSRMQLELQSPLFDPEGKRYVNRLALAWREKTALPVRVGLPVGDYLVNGEAVSVGPAAEASLELPMGALGARGLASLQVTRLEATMGVSVPLAGRTTNLLPAPTFGLGLTTPLGPLIIGLNGSYGAQSWYGYDHQVQAGGVALAGGLLVGTELQGRLPLAFRPALTARYLVLPGIALACEEAEGWTCAAPSEIAHPGLELYAIGQAIAPGLELGVEYREAGRTTALGTGVRIAVDHAFGQVPKTGTAELQRSEGQRVAWSAPDPGWQATSLTVSADLSIAF